MAPSVNIASPANSGTLSIFAYCFSSILMVVTNKYVLSGLDYNLNFLLLSVQVCADPLVFGRC
jgi:GDP-mannose transporter